MQTIILTQNKVALVDDDNFEELNKYNWCAIKGYNKYYAARISSRNSIETRKLIHMHRVILGITDKLKVDHINGDGLDNQKSNLREATSAQNSANYRPTTGKSYKGVTFHHNRWQVQIRINGEKTYIGVYKDEFEAALVYDKIAVETFGEFALLNKINN